MRYVPNQNLIGAQLCAVTQRAQDSRGFIHTGVVLAGVDPEVFISAAAAEEMGKLIGMVPKADVASLEEKFEHLSAQIEEVRELAEKIDKYEELEKELNVLAH
jgi:hypothetical protein